MGNVGGLCLVRQETDVAVFEYEPSFIEKGLDIAPLLCLLIRPVARSIYPEQ